MHFKHLLLGLALMIGCAPPTLVHPEMPDGTWLDGAEQVPEASLKLFDGFYDVEESDTFGDEVVLAARQGARSISLFSGSNNAYAVLKAGCIEDQTRLVLEGTWRYGHKVSTGTLRLEISPPKVAAALCRGEIEGVEGSEPDISGTHGKASKSHNATIRLTRSGPLLMPKDSPFLVVAHRGGCRTIDACGASENSIEVIKLAGALGANAIEVDIQMTADGVPILYHDTAFSDRLTQGLFCLGPVADFPLAHVQELCRLTYGEAIPTLREALEAVIYDTDIRGVWLDIKAVDALGSVIEIAKELEAEATAAGREINIMHGLWSEEILDAWIALDPAEGNCLVELEPEDVGSAGCKVWAPRWTLGPLTEEVALMQSKGRLVTFWTVDEAVFIERLLNQSTPDGILTNRPSQVFYRAQAHVRDEASVAP
ncbi:MAG: glycerophosphodiester phosphodiesterase [Myxococcota bacterium]